MPIESSDGLIRLCRKVRFREVAGEGVLVHLERGQVMVITEVGLHVVRDLAQGPARLADLVQSVVKDFEVEEEQAQRDVLFFLGQLRLEQVIEDVVAPALSP